MVESELLVDSLAPREFIKCLKPFQVSAKIAKRFKRSIFDVLGCSFLDVGCGQCPYCRAKTALYWSFRLMCELRVCVTADFLTLTYHDQFIPLDHLGRPCFNLKHHQDFIMALRNRVRRMSDREVFLSGRSRAYWKSHPVKFYKIDERGSKFGRVHYHSILFNLPVNLLRSDVISQCWPHGRYYRGDVTMSSVAYVAAYLINVPDGESFNAKHGDIMRPRMQCSKGIGVSYLSTINKLMARDGSLACRDYLIPMDGKMFPLSRYYIDKLNLSLSVRASRIRKAGDDVRKRYVKFFDDQVNHPDPYSYFLLVRSAGAERLLSAKDKSHSHF
ncbi:MAG: putative replication initiation protein [Microviridae sp.]|nr:MAG: putative replication initiation protein [Microviridae sp.]